jgi:hypothetical protein
MSKEGLDSPLRSVLAVATRVFLIPQQQVCVDVFFSLNLYISQNMV